MCIYAFTKDKIVGHTFDQSGQVVIVDVEVEEVAVAQSLPSKSHSAIFNSILQTPFPTKLGCVQFGSFSLIFSGRGNYKEISKVLTFYHKIVFENDCIIFIFCDLLKNM